MNYAIILTSNDDLKVNMKNCFFPLLGKSIIEYLVDSLKRNVDEIFCLSGQKNETSKIVFLEEVNYISLEKLKINLLKTKGSLIESDYTVFIPGNMPFVDNELIESIVKKHILNKNDLTFATIQKEIFDGCEVLEHNKDGRIEIIHKQDYHPDNLTMNECFTGIACIRNTLLIETLEQLETHSLMNALHHFSDKNKMGIFKIHEVKKAYQITDLYSFSCAEEELRNSINKMHMLNGVCILNPHTTTIAQDVKIDVGTIIYPGCNILGKTSIGKNCIIGPNTELKNATLEDEVSCVHSVVSNSTISKNAYVGPFAHIRSNSVIGMGDRIGNFVEIKNSTLGTRTDVAHLTYIGDTCCGDYVNWGCGCVTVNYDGQNKNKTIVGNHIFIGCNTNLIAPIIIGDHSFIAAGSTIDTNVEAGDFAIARARQINKKDYAKKYNSN